jgi:hypothetical protein
MGNAHSTTRCKMQPVVLCAAVAFLTSIPTAVWNTLRSVSSLPTMPEEGYPEDLGSNPGASNSAAPAPRPVPPRRTSTLSTVHEGSPEYGSHTGAEGQGLGGAAASAARSIPEAAAGGQERAEAGEGGVTASPPSPKTPRVEAPPRQVLYL